MARRRRSSVVQDLREFLPTSLTPRLEVGVRTRIALAQLEGLRREALNEIEDRRRFHPGRVAAPARDRNTRKARVVAASLLGSALHFADPVTRSGSLPSTRAGLSAARAAYSPKVVICVRRQRRREVLFAAGKAGRGGIRRSRRRNEFSDVNC